MLRYWENDLPTQQWKNLSPKDATELIRFSVRTGGKELTHSNQISRLHCLQNAGTWFGMEKKDCMQTEAAKNFSLRSKLTFFTEVPKSSTCICLRVCLPVPLPSSSGVPPGIPHFPLALDPSSVHMPDETLEFRSVAGLWNAAIFKNAPTFFIYLVPSLHSYFEPCRRIKPHDVN